jgi:putative ABC transport system substrate-binding protein
VRKIDDIERAFIDASEQRIDGLVVALDGILSQNRQIIVDLAAKHWLPAVYGSSEFILSGGLVAYGPSYSDLYRRAANYVDKILKGARPADLPVELPTKFQLVINLKTAKSLGLTIPPTILARADAVIE